MRPRLKPFGGVADRCRRSATQHLPRQRHTRRETASQSHGAPLGEEPAGLPNGSRELLPGPSGGPQMLRKFVVSSVIAVSAFAVAPGASEARSCPGANTVPSALGAGAANHTTLCLLNAQRRAHGLRPLRLDHKLG